jgi:hypothetical protein
VIRWAFRTAWSLAVTAIVLYFFFMVPLGERTLFQHVMRIVRTEEAQDLGREVGQAGERLETTITNEVEKTAIDAASARTDGGR